MYKYYFDLNFYTSFMGSLDSELLINSDLEKYKKMYRELMLKVHPDKNTNDSANANVAFISLANYYSAGENKIIEHFFENIDSLNLISIIINYIDKSKTDQSNVKKQVEQMQREYWYMYKQDNTFRELFVTQEEYDVLQKIQEEINLIRVQNESLQQELDSARKSLYDSFYKKSDSE